MYFNPQIACVVGVDAAIFLQNLHHWIVLNRANKKNIQGGEAWTYNSQKAYAAVFPFWTRQQIGRMIRKLEADGVIKSDCFNEDKRDQTKWYTLTPEGWALFEQIKTNDAVFKNEHSACSNADLPVFKSEPCNIDTDIKHTDINTDIKTPYNPPEGDVIASDFEIKKESFGEFKNVKLSDEENQKLKDVYGQDLKEAIETLDSYLENNPTKRVGKKAYKSHYAVLKQGGWVHQRVYANGREKKATAADNTAKEKNSGLLEHEILLKHEKLYYKASGRLIDTEGVEVKKTEGGFYLLKFTNGVIAQVGELAVPSPLQLELEGA